MRGRESSQIEPLILSVDEVAATFRVTPKTVRDWIRVEGLPVKRRGAKGQGNGARICVRQAFEWWMKRLESRSSTLDLEQQQARVNKERADGLEMENADRRSTLAAPEDAEEAWAAQCRTFRARLLGAVDGMAGTCNPQNPGLASRLIRAEYFEILSDLEEVSRHGN